MIVVAALGELRLVPGLGVRDAWLIGFPTVLATYPDGRFVPQWTRWVVAATAVVALGDAVGQGSLLNGQAASSFLPTVGILFVACQVHATAADRRSTSEQGCVGRSCSWAGPSSGSPPWPG